MVGYRYHAERPLTDAEREQVEQGLQVVPRFDPRTRLPLANKSNDYLIDRQMRKTANFTGIRGISEQDMAMTQSMGPIYARWNEHLGSLDVAVIAMRRVLLRLARRLMEDARPVAAYDGGLYRVRALETQSEEGTLQGVLEQNQHELVADAVLRFL